MPKRRALPIIAAPREPPYCTPIVLTKTHVAHERAAEEVEGATEPIFHHSVTVAPSAEEAEVWPHFEVPKRRALPIVTALREPAYCIPIELTKTPAGHEPAGEEAVDGGEDHSTDDDGFRVPCARRL